MRRAPPGRFPATTCSRRDHYYERPRFRFPRRKVDPTIQHVRIVAHTCTHARASLPRTRAKSRAVLIGAIVGCHFGFLPSHDFHIFRSKWVMQVGGGKTIVSYFSLFSVYLLDVYRRRIYFCIRMIYSYWNIGIACSIRIYRWRNVAICNRVGNKVSRALRQTIIPGECTGES